MNSIQSLKMCSWVYCSNTKPVRILPSNCMLFWAHDQCIKQSLSPILNTIQFKSQWVPPSIPRNNLLTDNYHQYTQLIAESNYLSSLLRDVMFQMRKQWAEIIINDSSTLQVQPFSQLESIVEKNDGHCTWQDMIGIQPLPADKLEFQNTAHVCTFLRQNRCWTYHIDAVVLFHSRQ